MTAFSHGLLYSESYEIGASDGNWRDIADQMFDRSGIMKRLRQQFGEGDEADALYGLHSGIKWLNENYINYVIEYRYELYEREYFDNGTLIALNIVIHIEHKADQVAFRLNNQNMVVREDLISPFNW